MQEMQDKNLVEIVKACKGSFIYAPGGTVNIGCVIFDGPSTAAKKAAPKKAESETTKKTTTRRRKSTTKVDDKVEPPKGDSAPPPTVDNVGDDDDDQGDGSVAADPSALSNADPAPVDADIEAAPTPADAGPADPAKPLFQRRRSSRRRRDSDNGA
jgi:hypothetical protein